MNAKILVFLAVLALSVASAHAIGIAPSRTILNFTPGMDATLDMFVRNNLHANLTARIYVRGELAQYLDCPVGDVFIPPSVEYHPFSCRLELPEWLPGPKRYDTRIGAMEVPEPGSGIGAVAGVESQLWIDVPDNGGIQQAQNQSSPASQPAAAPEPEQQVASSAPESAQQAAFPLIGVVLLSGGAAIALAAALLAAMLKLRIIRSR